MATMFKHKTASIPSLAAARPDVPAALDDLFTRMMAKEPADRIQTMAEVVRALEFVAASLSGSAATSSPAIAPRDVNRPRRQQWKPGKCSTRFWRVQRG